MMAYGLNALFLSVTDPTHWDWFKQPGNFDYFARHWRWVGMLALGLAIFTLSAALTGFRRGERWAWCTLWFWPVFLLFSAQDDWHGALFFLPLGLLALLALVGPFRAFFPRRTPVG